MPSGHRTKILHIITTLDVGGAELMLLRLLSLMDNEKFTNEVVTLSDFGPVGKKIKKMGIPVSALNIKSTLSGIFAVIILWYRLIKSRPDILQTWLYHSDLIGFIIGKLAFVKNICWNIRGGKRDFSSYGFSTNLSLNLCKLLSPLPDAVIVNSKAGKKFHSEIGYKPKKWIVIQNGIDIERFMPDSNAKLKLMIELENESKDNRHINEEQKKVKISEKSFLVGLVARYAPIKDHFTFIKGASLILDRRRDVRFILVGKNVTWDNISIVGQIPDKYHEFFFLMGERSDVHKIMAALDIATLVSLGEGFPNVICEAMASGVPCVVTDVGDSAEIVGDTGEIIPVKNPEALSNAIEKLLDLPPDEMRMLGERARSRIEENYSIDKILSKYSNLYLSIQAGQKNMR